MENLKGASKEMLRDYHAANGLRMYHWMMERVRFGDFSWIFQRNCMIVKLFWEQIGAGKEGGLFFSALNVCFAFGCYCRRGGLFS